MARTALVEASDALRAAAERASAERGHQLTETADTLSTLASREPGPDHGRLARLEYTLRELKEAANPEAVDHIDDALGQIKAYRKTVEGV
ncbi:DUF7553 family protein [Halohasta salina]|uniref:DUF7553 family protein n=1 Tax=Halohasta salina TaxID=2961621 RepID=UPI0020A59D66|nr:hypothetical protein [Halohasta salina]